MACWCLRKPRLIFCIMSPGGLFMFFLIQYTWRQMWQAIWHFKVSQLTWIKQQWTGQRPFTGNIKPSVQPPFLYANCCNILPTWRMLMLQVAFGRVRKAKGDFVISIRPSVWPHGKKILLLTGRIFVKFYIYDFYEKFSHKGTPDDDLHKFIIPGHYWSS